MHILIKKLILITLFLSLPHINAEGKSAYTIKDLEVLEQQSNYEEFLKHARDVRPSQRGKHWQKMLQHMSISYINFKTKRRFFDDKTFSFIESLAQWPALRQDIYFLAKREDYAKRFFKKCFLTKNKKLCLGKLKGHWHSSNKSPASGYFWAKMIRQFDEKEDIWMYVLEVATSKYANFYCHKPVVAREILQKYQKNFSEVENLKTLKKKIDLINHPECWAKMLPTLKQLAEDSSGLYQALYIKMLESKNSLTSEEKDYYLTLYILKAPVVGQMFNKAWSNLKELGQNYPRRKKVLKRLAALDPLPGKAFAIFDKTKRKTLLKFLYTNIPEYFTLFVKTCLSYLEGARIFPHGNPTLECKELLKFSKGTPWVTQPLRIRYSATQKF